MLNGWQRAALLLAGIAIAVGTYLGADLRGMTWIVGALVATALVVFGLKGLSGGQGAVVAVAVAASIVALGAGWIYHRAEIEGIVSTAGASVQKCETEKTEIVGQVTATKQKTDQGMMFAELADGAFEDAIKSDAVPNECATKFRLEFRRALQARKTAAIATERAAGRPVDWIEKLGTSNAKGE